MKKASAILVGDLHIQGKVPVCRTDDFIEAQRKKLRWLWELKETHSCPILCAGDLLDKAKPGESLLCWAIPRIPMDLYTVAGNHELPSHRLDKLPESGLGVLVAGGQVRILGPTRKQIVTGVSGQQLDVYGFSYGEDFIKPRNPEPHRVAVTHQMVWVDELPYPGCEAPDGRKLLKANPAFNLIVSGDNHQPFATSYEGRWLVNPGSMMRLTAAQKDHRPRAYLYYKETNEVEPAYFPIEKGVITRDHIEKAEKRDAAIDTFVERVAETEGMTLDFRENMKRHIEDNPPETAGVIETIWEAIG